MFVNETSAHSSQARRSHGYWVVETLANRGTYFSRHPFRCFGAGFQWWYPNFCPAFVTCLAFVQHMSSVCLNFVLFKHLSNICPKKPTFVLGKFNICLHSPTYVPFLSSDFVKNQQKIEGQNLVISWTCQFLHLASGHTAVGQKLDNMWT